MARILVPGGAGYIGSHVVRSLLDGGNQVVVLDNLSTGFAVAVDPRARLERLDLADTARVDALLASESFDAVIHFAASSVVPESMSDPLKYYLNNTANTASLLRSCVENGVSHIVFSSTAAVYGIPDGGIARESGPTAPINPYGSSKLMIEWMLRDVAAACNLTYVALRYFNVAGASRDRSLGERTEPATHLVKVAAQAALGRRDGMTLFGTDYDTPDGTCLRDYIHVEDLCTAHLLALSYLMDGGRSEVLNCGYGHGSSVRQVLQTMRTVSGSDFEIREDGRRAGDPPRLIAEADRIRQVLGWKPDLDDLTEICTSAWQFEARLT
ncbi:MAG: UDP-glucose 4-epimerase GalE [Myxococcota bacterium]